MQSHIELYHVIDEHEQVQVHSYCSGVNDKTETMQRHHEEMTEVLFVNNSKL